jgi:glycosyltransferase involved in cell wall biosynthesis
MKLIGLCVTKNEADILGFCLRHASKYFDRIFVLDNGSTDGTWEIARRAARESSVVVPFEQKECAFARGIRAYLWECVRRDFSGDDWFMILDSDEFLEEDPRPLIRECMKQQFDTICAMQAHFYIVGEDLSSGWFRNATEIGGFDELPAHYQLNNKERRIFRNRTSLVWPIYGEDGNFSNFLFPVDVNATRKMVINRHYQYRSKQQIEQRIRQRAEVFSKTGCFKHHSNMRGLETYVKEKKYLKKLDRNGKIECKSFDFFNVEIYKMKKEFQKFIKRRLCLNNNIK